MNSKLKLHLEKVLLLESTSLELILEQSLSKEVFLNAYAEYNNFYITKEIYIDFVNNHLLEIKMYSYEQ